MQYEYIGQTPNENDFVKGKSYFVNPKRDDEKVICNIEAVTGLGNHVTQHKSTVVYDNIPAFRHDWKVVSAELIQDRTEAAELVS